MLDRLPQVLTLRRPPAPEVHIEAAKARPLAPDKYVPPNPAKDKRMGFWLTLIIIFWALVPLAAIILFIVNKLILKR